jgi:hypothetical protein
MLGRIVSVEIKTSLFSFIIEQHLMELWREDGDVKENVFVLLRA